MIGFVKAQWIVARDGRCVGAHGVNGSGTMLKDMFQERSLPLFTNF